MHRREVDWVLTDISWVVTCDEVLGCIAEGGVAVENDTLVAIGPCDAIRNRFRGRRTMNLSGFLVMPGLINTHTHGAMSCFRGLGDDLPLLRWLHEVIFPAERAHVNREFVYWGTLLSAVEMLHNGVTTLCDGYFFEEAAAQAALDAGIRGVLAQGILDFPTPDTADPQKAVERAKAFLEVFPRAEGRVRPSLFCHAPYTCSPETLQWVKALCREQGILFQMHLSETAGEVEDHTLKYGERPVFTLDRLGILDDHTLFSHGIWLDDAEVRLLADRGASISHNAESDMKLASGVAPVPKFLASGVNVGLGTDGSASNNDQDLFSEMDKVAKLHKVFAHDPVICNASEVLRMATFSGAKALGWSDEIGSLREGKKADLIAIDLNQPHLTPLYDPVSHLVYAVKGSDVRHVWVNGSLVVADGRVYSVDETKVMEKVTEITDKLCYR